MRRNYFDVAVVEFGMDDDDDDDDDDVVVVDDDDDDQTRHLRPQAFLRW